MRIHRLIATAAVTALMLATAACGGDSLESSGADTGSGDTGGGDKGTVVVGGQDFTESQVLAAIYQKVLENEGFTVQTKLVTTRDVYLPELSSGGVDIVPDYLAGITDYLNTEKNGPDAPLVSSNDVDKTLEALKPLAEAKGISILPPSDATDQNAFFVTQDFADQNSLTTLSDLAALGDPIKLGAPPDCEGRADCEGGLTKVYGLKITEIVPLDFASAQVKDAVKKGDVTMGETGTTDGTLAADGLVLLEDDKGIQPAQNLTPAVNADFLKANPDLEDIFNQLSAALTTDDLAQMNLKVDAERQKPEDVAQQFLQDKGLL
ncbi:ABC transporter substrate-binding protein [Nocardioides islandensis]|jgi:osmoprotectant transport system substrate-binding protein|uniref:ABC transporter substrate-binding protein n=1 Tax=Nocardioides islandensis TaxID=433663 RepID=A0A930VEF4_9ACTN|nr:ABC transporter substrate-binding protein [Nocardioides islandensis]MBF4762460.1 ABC transporter substrate-binding protein [Nocardioides islandensis]